MNVSCVWCVGEGEAVHTDGVCGMYMCVCVGGVCLHSVCDWGGGGGVAHMGCAICMCVGVHMAWVVCVCTVCDVCGGCVCAGVGGGSAHGIGGVCLHCV